GLRRLGGSSITPRDRCIVVKTPAQEDFWWGNFVLLGRPVGAGQAAGLRRLFLAEFPHAAHLAFGVDGTEGAIGDRGEIDELGLSAEVNTVLSAPRLREPPAPRARGVAFRPLQDDDDWAPAADLRLSVYADDDSSNQRGFVERQLAASRRVCEEGAGAWFGAFANGHLVASLGVIATEPGLARYQMVETHPDHRRRGLASWLLFDAGRYAADVLGAHTLVIVADPDDSAIRVYRSLGFSAEERQVQLQRPAGSLGSRRAVQC
ncbi:MAG: GNAT family N-acetyltransferase, partial [Solirubrobacterales bacterium]|nr:GNAT family N-acetyltransferase [Solirubrobacterales bacterium]